jgi:predicted XRE-type DNA-binding protein
VKKNERKKIEFEEGSGNVFADLGLTDADELYARAQIGFGVYKILEGKELKQREMADLLGIPQPEVSHLMNGHFSRFTTDKLLDFLKRLDKKVTIEIGPHKPGEPYKVIGFAP